MLTSLLPGFRHLRTPFVAGVLVTFQFWTLYGGLIPGPREASGFLKRLYALGELAGRPITTAAIAFLIYVAGQCVTVTMDMAIGISRVFKRPLMFLSPDTRYQLVEIARTAFDGQDAPNPDAVAELARNMRIDFANVRMRLIAEHLDVYLEYDRIESEAEFRFNIAVHSVGVWVVLASQWSAWFLAGFVLSVVIFRVGVLTLRAANALIVQSLESGIVTSQVYELARQRVNENSEEAGAAPANSMTA
ncbi:hypothetical protein ACWDLL_09395 [Streptomyces griseoincarnatus]